MRRESIAPRPTQRQPPHAQALQSWEAIDEGAAGTPFQSVVSGEAAVQSGSVECQSRVARGLGPYARRASKQPLAKIDEGPSVPIAPPPRTTAGLRIARMEHVATSICPSTSFLCFASAHARVSASASRKCMSGFPVRQRRASRGTAAHRRWHLHPREARRDKGHRGDFPPAASSISRRQHVEVRIAPPQPTAAGIHIRTEHVATCPALPEPVREDTHPLPEYHGQRGGIAVRQLQVPVEGSTQDPSTRVFIRHRPHATHRGISIDEHALPSLVYVYVASASACPWRPGPLRASSAASARRRTVVRGPYGRLLLFEDKQRGRRIGAQIGIHVYVQDIGQVEGTTSLRRGASTFTTGPTTDTQERESKDGKGSVYSKAGIGRTLPTPLRSRTRSWSVPTADLKGREERSQRPDSGRIIGNGMRRKHPASARKVHWAIGVPPSTAYTGDAAGLFIAPFTAHRAAQDSEAKEECISMPLERPHSRETPLVVASFFFEVEGKEEGVLLTQGCTSKGIKGIHGGGEYHEDGSAISARGTSNDHKGAKGGRMGSSAQFARCRLGAVRLPS
ncbi:hypothetical protein B0H11DRAFT_1913504 [Mycena galericulata]|nr:hypothetical protein B0H11DRAFT_1913504 [Mycena galericulata]